MMKPLNNSVYSHIYEDKRQSLFTGDSYGLELQREHAVELLFDFSLTSQI